MGYNVKSSLYLYQYSNVLFQVTKHVDIYSIVSNFLKIKII